MEIVLQWLDDLDDLVFAGLSCGRRLLLPVVVPGVVASLLLVVALNGLFGSPFA